MQAKYITGNAANKYPHWLRGATLISSWVLNPAISNFAVPLKLVPSVCILSETKHSRDGPKVNYLWVTRTSLTPLIERLCAANNSSCEIQPLNYDGVQGLSECFPSTSVNELWSWRKHLGRSLLINLPPVLLSCDLVQVLWYVCRFSLFMMDQADLPYMWQTNNICLIDTVSWMLFLSAINLCSRSSVSVASVFFLLLHLITESNPGWDWWLNSLKRFLNLGILSRLILSFLVKRTASSSYCASLFLVINFYSVYQVSHISDSYLDVCCIPPDYLSGGLLPKSSVWLLWRTQLIALSVEQRPAGDEEGKIAALFFHNLRIKEVVWCLLFSVLLEVSVPLLAMARFSHETSGESNALISDTRLAFGEVIWNQCRSDAMHWLSQCTSDE